MKALSDLAAENPEWLVDQRGGRAPIPVPFDLVDREGNLPADLADQGGQPGGLHNSEPAGPRNTLTDPPCSRQAER